MEFTKAKAVAAAIGTFIEALKVVLLDNVIDVNEVGSLITSLIILGGTVYAVFKVRNEPINQPETPLQPMEG
jgi:hypothetical protein